MSAGDGLAAAVSAAARGERPPLVALMHVLIESPSEAAATAALTSALAQADAVGADRLAALLALWQAHPDAWSRVRSTIDGIDHEADDASPDGRLRYWASAFDRLVAASPEASVALYSLGSPALLEEVTREAVQRMEAWGLLGPDIDVLDLGCGIGRFAIGLAPRVRSVVGLDLSAGMVAEARRRCGALANVSILSGTGRDLAPVATGTIDLVLAADVFPYLVGAGGGLAETHMAEMARVLRPGGRALIWNFSYRGDDGQDRLDVTAAAGRAGLTLLRPGTRDLRSWDAAAFLLAMPPRA